MTVEIISIGDELLIGQTINTNAAWMGEELSRIGTEVEFCTVIKDEEEVIFNSFKTALDRVDVVLVTGGAVRCCQHSDCFLVGASMPLPSWTSHRSG